MRTRCWPMLASLLVACASSKDEVPRYEALDIAAFRAMLGKPDEAATLERVKIEPEGSGRARYVVYLKTSPKRRAAIAEFPGPIVDELYGAGVMYNVKPRGVPYVASEHEHDAGFLRRILTEPDEVARIEQIRIQPTAEHAAKYMLRIKGSSVTYSVYAEHPGTIVPAIQTAGIPYTMSP